MLFPWLNRTFRPDTPSASDLQADTEGFAKAARLMEKLHGPEFAAMVNNIQHVRR